MFTTPSQLRASPLTATSVDRYYDTVFLIDDSGSIRDPGFLNSLSDTLKTNRISSRWPLETPRNGMNAFKLLLGLRILLLTMIKMELTFIS